MVPKLHEILTLIMAIWFLNESSHQAGYQEPDHLILWSKAIEIQEK